MHNIARSAASAALALFLATGTLLATTTLVAPAFAQAAPQSANLTQPQLRGPCFNDRALSRFFALANAHGGDLSA